ncbi:hypothetical protein A4W95_00334 [Treponema pallidum subsp. pallidum]|nr:hypothetical protein A4W95_00334 [Treponema pallidum subsp. pallidum]
MLEGEGLLIRMLGFLVAMLHEVYVPEIVGV